jgi:hypothetical protein
MPLRRAAASDHRRSLAATFWAVVPSLAGNLIDPDQIFRVEELVLQHSVDACTANGEALPPSGDVATRPSQNARAALDRHQSAHRCDRGLNAGACTRRQ